MISAVTLNYRLHGVHTPGSGETGKATISVVQKGEAEAYAQAVNELKLDLFVTYANFKDPVARRTMFDAILRLKPWVHDYTYVKSADRAAFGSDPSGFTRV